MIANIQAESANAEASRSVGISHLGNLVRMERQRRGLTQQTLADMAKVSKGRVEAIENGRCLDMGVGTVKSVAEALGFNLIAIPQD